MYLILMNNDIDCDWNTYWILIEVHNTLHDIHKYFWLKYIFTVMQLLMEIHIDFWWKYIFTFGSPGRSPSSFIVFWPSGLQWPKRNRWPFLRAYRHRKTFVPISHRLYSAMTRMPSKTPTQINLYRFCTAARWKNNLMKNGTSHIFF